METLLDVPFKEKFVATGTVGPEMVMLGLVESWDNVMLAPATSAKAVDEAVFAVPLVAPPAADVIVCSIDWLLAEMVIVFPALPIPIFAPAEMDKVPEEPFSEEM
jgi:hypothetical protein